MFFISACFADGEIALRPYVAGKALRKRLSHENVG